MKLSLGAAALLCSCGPSAATLLTRDACYESAENKFWDSVEECKENGQDFEECDLMEPKRELRAEQEECP